MEEINFRRKKWIFEMLFTILWMVLRDKKKLISNCLIRPQLVHERDGQKKYILKVFAKFMGGLQFKKNLKPDLPIYWVNAQFT